MATKIIIPVLEAVKFPSIEVNFSDGKLLKLPIDPTRNENMDDADKSPVPKVSLLCLSFRANSQVWDFSSTFGDFGVIGF